VAADKYVTDMPLEREVRKATKDNPVSQNGEARARLSAALFATARGT